jgi:hypothetical protein
MRKAVFFLLLHSFVAAVAVAQITVGVMPSTLNSSDANFPTPQTDVSLENPVTGSGNIDTVTFGWNATCTGVAKIKFFHRTGNTLTMFAERGPFDTLVSGRTQFVTLNPPVGVAPGDLIAITRVVSCGNALAEAGTGTQGYVVLQGDATSGTVSSGNTFHDKLGLMGTGSAPLTSVQGYIPVVGSTAGSFGSNFKTSVQIFNPSATSIATGKLIFHKSGTSGTLNDPSLVFNVGPNEIISFTDAVAAMTQTGLGSMDVVMAPGAQLPIVVSRIYNDQGANGTSGVFEDLITPDTGVGTRILTLGTQGFLLTPIEPARTRMNIGVRSLSSGATLTLSLEDSTGHVLGSLTKTYQPDIFEQQGSDFFFGVSVGANQKIRLTVTSGSAIVYGATTDNVTNDPSVQFATALPVP